MPIHNLLPVVLAIIGILLFLLYKLVVSLGNNNALAPLQNTLITLQKQITETETNHQLREQNIRHSLENLFNSQKELKEQTSLFRSETAKIMNTFRKPSVRGKWGEMQLRKIAEITGMLQFCEFEMQVDMGEIRPDMVIKLPNSGVVFVDSKAPLEASLHHLEHDNNLQLIKENVKAIKNHIYTLSNKKYWSKALSPEFVIMFIPLESLWLHALDEDPKLIEYATDKNVIVATPMTLIGLLKTIFFGWNQLYISKETEKLQSMLTSTNEDLDAIGKTLTDTMRNLSSAGRNLHACLDIVQFRKNALKDFDKSPILPRNC